MCFGCCAAFAATSVGSCLCSCCSVSPPRRAAKYVYGVLFLIGLVLTWVLRDYGTAALWNLYSYSACTTTGCVSSLTVLRISFGLSAFFFLMFLSTAGAKLEGSCRDWWHSGWWPIKIVGYLLLLFLTFLLPYQVFQVFGEIAIVGSIAFLIIQLVSMINFVYVWNDAWLENEARHPWMIVVSVLCYGLIIAGIALEYVFFAPRASCGLNIFFITFTLVIVICLTAISMHSKVDAGPLTSGVMGLYFVFLCWSAIMSEPMSETCNTRPRQGGNGGWLDILGLCLAIFSIAISVYATGIDSRCFSLKPTPQSDATSENGAGDGEIPYGYGFFHIVFLTGSMYMAMLFLGWNLSSTPANWSLDSGWFSVWVKMTLMWLSALVYLWTMIAPIVLPGRDFGTTAV